MQTLFGLLVVCGAAASRFNRCDLLTAGSSVIVSDVAPGVLLRVCLRCLLGFCLRMCGFVGLVLTVAGVDCSCPPSVASPTPSERDNLPPFVITLIAFFNYLIAVFLGLFFKCWTLLIHSCATSLLCCCSNSVGS